MIDKGVCDKLFIWNPSNCECVCGKPCHFGEHLDFKNWKCRKRLVDKLIEDCVKTIEKIKIAERKNKCGSCVLDIVFFSIFFAINIKIGGYFVY